MTENEPQEQVPAEETPKKKSGGLLKYILFGIAGVAVIIAVAFGTIMLMGKSSSAPAATTETPAVTDSAASQAGPGEIALHVPRPEVGVPRRDVAPDTLGYSADSGDWASALDSTGSEADLSVLQAIKDNLAFLEQEPDTQSTDQPSETTSQSEPTAPPVSLEAEKAALAERESQVAKREAELQKRQEDIDQKLLKLQQEQTSRITELAKLYDGMEAKAVAQLMANLDDETVVAILPRMKPKNASAVLGLLPAPRAASISKQMITIAGD